MLETKSVSQERRALHHDLTIFNSGKHHHSEAKGTTSHTGKSSDGKNEMLFDLIHPTLSYHYFTQRPLLFALFFLFVFASYNLEVANWK